MAPRPDLTLLIRHAREGSGRERDALFEAVYDELKRIAASVPRVGRVGETMQPTVLTHELWLELARRFPDAPRAIEESRATFFRSVALAMRTILRDYHRGRVAAKRGGGRARAGLDDLDAGAPGEDGDSARFLAIDEAIEALEAYNERWHAVVLQRFYGGRTIEQTAEILGVAPSTVIADWKLARAWLRGRLQESDDGGAADGPAA